MHITRRGPLPGFLQRYWIKAAPKTTSANGPAWTPSKRCTVCLALSTSAYHWVGDSFLSHLRFFFWRFVCFFPPYVDQEVIIPLTWDSSFFFFLNRSLTQPPPYTQSRMLRSWPPLYTETHMHMSTWRFPPLEITFPPSWGCWLITSDEQILARFGKTRG